MSIRGPRAAFDSLPEHDRALLRPAALPANRAGDAGHAH